MGCAHQFTHNFLYIYKNSDTLAVMSPEQELEQIYISIGGGEIEITEAIDARIRQLEDIINPRPVCFTLPDDRSNGCGCDNPNYCWDCAAIRGGCPEDV